MRNTLLILVLSLAAAGCLPPSGDGVTPSPSPSPDVRPEPVGEVAIERVFADYRAGLKAVFEEVAGKIERGEIRSDIEQNTFIHERSRAVREDAFMLLNRDVIGEIDGPNWSPEKAAKYWREQAEAL